MRPHNNRVNLTVRPVTALANSASAAPVARGVREALAAGDGLALGVDSTYDLEMRLEHWS